MEFFMLCGLPGSGKSTYAKKLAEQENALIFSSDETRKELFGSEDDQDHNEEVFNTLHKRIIDALSQNQSAIYDATNISSKQRKAFMESIKKFDCKKIAIIIATPYKTCLEQNAHRERKVPEFAIKRVYMNFTVPCVQEGFAEVSIVHPDDFSSNKHLDILFSYMGLPHDNPHHSATIGQHMVLAYDRLVENEEYERLFPDCDLALELATMLHDIGKPFTKTFTNSRGETTEIAHYYSHNNVGAYEILLTDIPEKLKPEVALLVQYHMNYYTSWKQSEKAKEKDRKFLGDEFFKKLELLHEADLAAH